MAVRKPIPLPAPTQEIEDKLLNRVVRTSRGCWEWQGAKNRHGYGTIIIGGKFLKTHRLAFGLFCGPIPDGSEVCHNCPGGDNPSCCNPVHLFAASHSGNMKDAATKGTCRPEPLRGQKNPNTHLTEDMVREIRRRAAENKGVPGWRKQLATEFRISGRGISRVVSGEVWGHVR